MGNKVLNFFKEFISTIGSNNDAEDKETKETKETKEMVEIQQVKFKEKTIARRKYFNLAVKYMNKYKKDKEKLNKIIDMKLETDPEYRDLVKKIVNDEIEKHSCNECAFFWAGGPHDPSDCSRYNLHGDPGFNPNRNCLCPTYYPKDLVPVGEYGNSILNGG